MDIRKLISQGELETVEFKQSTGEWKEIIETIAAFANTIGGKIFIGISKTGKILGADVGKNTIEDLTNKISINLDPKIHPRVSIEKTNGKSLIVITVKESSDHLVLAFGRPYKRIGKSTVRMSKDEYEQHILEKHKDKFQFDMQICKGITSKNINRKRLEWFVKEAKTQRGLDIDGALSTKEIIKRLKLTRNGKLTNAAVLLFSNKPQDIFLQAVVKAIRFKGLDVTEDMLDFKIIDGDVFTLLEKAEDFIFEHIPKKAWIEEGKLQRQEKWLYPPKVIREALANALAHRDYKLSSNVQIRIFDDRIEFWNPGCLPKGLTVEGLKRKHDSMPQNPLIARSFFWVRYVEEVGTGTNKMLNWCRDWGLSEPEFEETETSFVVTLRQSKLTDEYLGTLNLNVRQIEAIDYLRKNKKITNKEYSAINKIGRVCAFKELADLVKKGVLRQIEKGRSAYYIVSD